MVSLSVTHLDYVRHAAYIVNTSMRNDELQREITALAAVSLPNTAVRFGFSEIVGGILVIEGLWTTFTNMQIFWKTQEENPEQVPFAAGVVAGWNLIFCAKAAVMYGAAAAVDRCLGESAARKTAKLAEQILTIVTTVKNPREAVKALRNILKDQKIQSVQCREIQGAIADEMANNMF